VVRDKLSSLWTRTLFAGTCDNTNHSTSPIPALVVLAVVAGLLFFTKLSAPLLEPQEPRYAEIPRQMLLEHRFVVPVLHGEPYLDKPPLLYWLVIGSYSLFGVSDRAARLVPGLAGVLSVLVAYLWGRRVAGERAGLCGALVLSLSPGFIYRERMLTFDAVLCLWVTVALAAAHVALSVPRVRRGWWIASAVACGLGLLTKGPVAFVLIAAPVLAYLVLDPRTARLSWRDGLTYPAVAGGVALPWYAAIICREPRFALSFFWTHNVVRYLQPFDHEEPFWFYFPGLVLGLLPWGLLLPGLIRFLTRRDADAASRRAPALGFFLLSASWTILFFSAAGCKRSVYLLPAQPPLALALGYYLSTLLPEGAAALQWLTRRGLPWARNMTLAALVLAATLVAAAAFKGMIDPLLGVALAGLALGGLFVCSFNRNRGSWLTGFAVTFALLYFAVCELQPAYNRQFALREELEQNAAMLPGERLFVACYPQAWDSVTFYLPNADVRVYHADNRAALLRDLLTRPQTLLLVKSKRLCDDLLCDLPDSVEFVSRGPAHGVTVGCLRVTPPALQSPAASTR
jgi:4-amino-4-deoxy-L-arabinose transferase-like glycosyltransferase